MSRVTTLTFALSVSLSAAAWPAIAAEPVEEAISGWIEQLDSVQGFTANFASLDYDNTSDAAMLTGLTIEHAPAGIKLSFEPISVSGYSESGDGTFDVDSVSCDGAAIAAEGFTGTMSSIRFEGLGNIPKDFSSGIAWDPQRPFTSLIRVYSRIVDIRLAHGFIGDTSFAVKVEDADMIASYKDVAIDGWADGKIASVTSGPLLIETSTPEGPLTMSVASTSGRDFDFAAMLRVYDPDQYVGGVGDGIWRTAAANFEYNDIRFDGPGAKVTFATVGMENFRIRQPERSFAEFLDQAMLDPHANREPTPDELRALLGYFSAFSFGAMTMRDMAFDADDGSTGKLGGITIRDFSSERIGEFSIDDFAGTKPGEGSVNIGRIAFGGVVFPPLEVLLEAAETEMTGAGFDYTRLAAQLAFFEALGIDVDVPDSPRVKLDKARLDLGNYVGPIPTLLALDVSGADLPVDAIENPNVRSTWQALGYDRVRGDFSAKLAWNEADQSVSIDGVRLAITDVGALSLSAQLVGLTREALGNLDSLPEAMIGMSFVGGALALEDYPILDRWIDQQAAATSVEPTQLRQQIAVLMTQMTANIGNADFRDQLHQVLAASIMIPGSVTATAMPTAPVPLAALAVLAQSAPANLPDILGITIEQSSAPQ